MNTIERPDIQSVITQMRAMREAAQGEWLRAQQEPEAVLVEVRGLLRVSHVDLDVVDAEDGEEVDHTLATSRPSAVTPSSMRSGVTFEKLSRISALPYR